MNILELKVQPTEKKLAQQKQKWLNHFSRMEDNTWTSHKEFKEMEV